jgi:hypothetical protein
MSPYIPQDRRGRLPETAGELSYAFTWVINQYLGMHADSYQTFNDIIGALEGAKAEFIRRVVNPYEDEAMKRNGDVYDT